MEERNEAYQNIVTRKSIRLYSDEPVSAADTDALLHAGMSAPTGVNRQPWEFIAVDDAAVKERLAEALPYAKMAAHAPLVIVVCGNSERFLEGDDATLWVQDVSAASENILLAAHALGLGAVWTCLYPHADRMKAAAEILNIPEGVVPFSLIPVGHPRTEQQKPMDKWKPERVHRNQY